MKYKVFISANQKEMKQERLSVKKFISDDPLLKKYFDVFVFEETPARSSPAKAKYLGEVMDCDVYIGILGNLYGAKDKAGLSATETEFRCAKKQRREILIFIKGNDDSLRDSDTAKMICRVKKPQSGHIYKRFNDVQELNSHVHQSLITYLEEKGAISSSHFDLQICKGALLKDIDAQKVKWFIDKAKESRGFDIPSKSSLKEVLERLGLTQKGRLTNAAILIFGKNPQKFFIQSKIRCGRMKGSSGYDFIDMKVLDGTVPELREAALKFVTEHIRRAVYFDQNRRHDKWEYPLRAIEEVVTNALAHRDYISNSDIQLAVYDDRIEVWNPGGLPKQLKPQDLKKKHKSLPRNKLLADQMFLIKHIEKWGMGTNRIVEEMRESGLSDPKFQNISGGFEVALIGPGKKFEKELERSKQEILNINSRQKNAVKYIKEKERIDKRTYMKINNVSNKTAFLELKDMLGKGIVSQNGRGRSVYYTFRGID